MTPKISNFTTGTLTNVSISGIPFLPTVIDFWVVDRPAAVETAARLSEGSADGTKQFCVSNYQDVTGGTSKGYFDRCINVKDRVSGSITDVLVANLASIDTIVAGSNYGFTLNFPTKMAGWKIYYKAIG